MALSTTAAVAGVSAAAAYLDGKYHIRKDLLDLQEERQVGKLWAKRLSQGKQSLWYFFEEQARRLGDDVRCMWFRPEKTEITYSWTETYDNACRWAAFLLENGVQPGELVGTYLQNSPDFMFNMLGSWAIGAAPAMINYNLSGEALIHCLKVANPSRILLVDNDPSCRQRIEAVRDRIETELGMKIFFLDPPTRQSILSRSAVRPPNSLRAKVDTSSPAFLFYTSGTTGFPKACAFTQQRAYVLGFPRLRLTELQRLPSDNVWYDCMPLYHGTGCTVACGCMMEGVGLAIGRKFSVRNFWPDIHDSGATCFVYVGETARYLLAAPPSRLDRGHKLKCMYGNGMRPDVFMKFKERFDIPIVGEFFNSTEGMLSLLNVCKNSFHAGHVGHHGAIKRWLLRNRYVPVKIDHEGSGDAIWRDPKTGFAKRNSYEEGGEILVACTSEKDFVGYWNNPTATQKRFEHDVFRKGDVWYRSGDALRRDADGKWYFLDRLGDTFRWKSENVSTAEVAEALGKFPGLVEANVYGVEVPGHDGRAGCAAVYIKPADRERFDYTGLLAHARKTLPKYAVPVFLRVIKSPTPMHNNKQNKVPLRKEGVDPEKIKGGEAGREDVVFWAKPGAETYERFGEAEWKAIVAGKARL